MSRKSYPCNLFFIIIIPCVGSAPGAEDVGGTITVPEVAHDTEEDEFVVSVKSLPSRRLLVEHTGP
jgi:hypothetical protein